MRNWITISESQPTSRIAIRAAVCRFLVCAVVGGSWIISGSLHAECGSYVTIGNRAKASELRAAGFDVDGKMTAHDAAAQDDQVYRANHSSLILGFGDWSGNLRVVSNPATRALHFSNDELFVNQYVAGLRTPVGLESPDSESISSNARPEDLPCSGPHCNSKRKSLPLPQPVNVSISTSKTGLVATAKPACGRESFFCGFHSSDDSPLFVANSLDRPPE